MKRTVATLVLVTLAAALACAQEPAPTAAPAQKVRILHQGPGEPAHEGGMHMPPPPPPPGLPGMGAWWKNSDIARELNLTDAQRKQLEQTFLDYRMKLVDLRADLERQELKLEPLVDADSPDENAISAQLDQVIAARGRLEKSNALMGLSMRKVLNQVQWKKLQTMHRERMPMAPRAPLPPRMMRKPLPPAADVPPAPPAPGPNEPL